LKKTSAQTSNHGETVMVAEPLAPAAAPTVTMLGRYEIRETLGKGAMGEVYRGWDSLLQLDVAVKVLLPQRNDAGHPPDTSRFLREVKISRTLQHPNIVTIYDVNEDPATGRLYIVMEFIKGRPLHLLAAERSFSIPEIVRLIGQAAEALDYAAQAGVIHRDIKPANLLIDPEKLTLKVVDFGVARMEGSDLTQTGTVLGTPHYMSPEQSRREKVDGRSDLFSIGAVLYELLTSQKAFPGETVGSIIAGILSPRFPIHIGTRRPDLPPALNAVVMKALAKDPSQRYQRGREMAQALRLAASSLGEHNISAPSMPAVQPAAIPSSGRSPAAAIKPVVPAKLPVAAGGVSQPSKTPVASSTQERIEAWCAEQVWPPRAALLVFLEYVGAHHLSDSRHVNLILGILNGIIYGTGHALLDIVGSQFLSATGGSLLLVIVPVMAAVLCLRVPDYFAVSACGAWLAASLYQIAPFVADARAQVLPLVMAEEGGCDLCRDWHYLLSTLHLLPWDTKLAAFTRGVAFLFTWGSIAAGGWMVWKMAKS
jgi:serine/threonine protein kinase